jgi:hypothetical protein
MDGSGPIRRLIDRGLRWAEAAQLRVLAPLFLVAVIGPLGEVIDAALVMELEAELFATDLGIEIVASILAYGYHLVLFLLGTIALAALPQLFPAEGPVPVRALASCRPRRLAKIPIR